MRSFLNILFGLTLISCGSSQSFQECVEADAQVTACEDDAYETYLDCFNDCWTNSCTEVCEYEYEDDLETCWDIEMERIDAC